MPGESYRWRTPARTEVRCEEVAPRLYQSACYARKEARARLSLERTARVTSDTNQPSLSGKEYFYEQAKRKTEQIREEGKRETKLEEKVGRREKLKEKDIGRKGEEGVRKKKEGREGGRG